MDAFDLKFWSFDRNIYYSFLLHYNLLPSFVLISLCLTLNQGYLLRKHISNFSKSFRSEELWKLIFCFAFINKAQNNWKDVFLIGFSASRQSNGTWQRTFFLGLSVKFYADSVITLCLYLYKIWLLSNFQGLPRADENW